MLHFLHRRCRLQRHDDFINVDDAGWYQPLVYPIFASCVGGLINFGLKNENNSQWMMMTEKGKQVRLPMAKIRSQNLLSHYARWISIQFYINIRINITFILPRKETSKMLRCLVATFGSRQQNSDTSIHQRETLKRSNGMRMSPPQKNNVYREGGDFY